MTSFLKYKDVVEEGDMVILYVNYRHSYPLKLKRTDTFQTSHGAFRHEYAVGKPYGCRIKLTKGSVYVLHPTPELWAVNLRHRTQILYPPDINLVTMGLELRPRSRVVEAGTGSGALSHGIARAICPSGHLFTFDCVQDRVDCARKEFAAHGISSIVTVACSDVCAHGFDDSLDGSIDAVFLDMPTPWVAVPNAKRLLNNKPGHVTRICCFSPCIEQAQRNVQALQTCGFTAVETVSTATQEMKVEQITLPSPQAFYRPPPPDPRTQTVPSRPEYEAPTARVNSEEPAAKCMKLNPTSVSDDSTCDHSLNSTVDPPRPSIVSAAVYPATQPTHNGYLTFATLLPE